MSAKRVVGEVFLFLLAWAVGVFVLYEPLLFGPILLVEAFSKGPLLGSLVLLLLGVVCFLCFVGSRMESRRGVYFLSRAFLLLFSLTAGLVSVELLLAVIGVAIAVSSRHAVSREYYLSLIGGLSLVLLGAAGVKHALGFRARYWIVALVALAVAVLTMVISQLLVWLPVFTS